MGARWIVQAEMLASKNDAWKLCGHYAITLRWWFEMIYDESKCTVASEIVGLPRTAGKSISWSDT